MATIKDGDLNSMEMDKYFEGFIEKSADERLDKMSKKFCKNIQ